MLQCMKHNCVGLSYWVLGIRTRLFFVGLLDACMGTLDIFGTIL